MAWSRVWGILLAADPDNDVNNDDNGSPLAGAGVVSQAITLAGATEPTNDGDANSNSNLTVDFGFFGFDLALDKSVQQTSIAPKETLNYSVKIDNTGPSAAAGTTFKDTLPSFATFVSGTVSIPGVTLQHAGGVITADLGTMQPGATVIITVQALVSDDATGTLGQHGHGLCTEGSESLEQHRLGLQSSDATHRSGHNEDR